MAGIFTTLEDLIKSILDDHIDKSKIAQIQTDIAALKVAVQSIQLFLGAPNSGATQDQLDALSKRVTDETGVIQQADAGFQPPQT